MSNSEDTLRQNTIKEIKNSKLPVVIFGAEKVGEALLYACKENKIEVACFCDSNQNKANTIINGVKVIYTKELKKHFNNALFIISAGDIQDIIILLNELGYTKWYSSNFLLRNFNIYKYTYSQPHDFVEYAVNSCLLSHDGFLNPDKVFVRNVDVIITERCSLKCRNCSNLMQYYENPEDCNIDDVIRSIDILCDWVDGVSEFRVIGGEPFMNKNCYLVVNRLNHEQKVKKIVIYTNGTIIPKGKQLEALKSNKVLLIITDYGELSKNLSKLVEELEKNSISYLVQKVGGWSDCSKIEKFNRGLKEQKEIFSSCCVKNFITLTDGKLFRCPFSANVFRLHAVPNNENEHIDLFQEINSNLGLLEIKKKIRAFLMDKETLNVCDYCQGRPFGATEIEPAIQTKKPLEYIKYPSNSSNL